MAGRFLEDFSVGEVIDSPEDYEMTLERIHDFASEFDPQPMHTNEEAAQRSFFGEMTASGWHTLSVMMRLMVRSPLFASGEVIGVGVDNLSWLLPVKPGDRLRGRAEVTAIRESKSRPDRGFMNLHATTLRGSEIVASQDWTVLVPRRDVNAG